MGPLAQPQAEPADNDPERDFAEQDEDERSGGGWQRKRAGRDRQHREAIEDQRGGVVGEAFAFEDDENPMRQMQPLGDRQRRDHVGWRDDGAEHEADAPGQAEQRVRRSGDRASREDHAADGEQRDRPQVGLEFPPAHGDAGGIDQRRQHHQQHAFRFHFDERKARYERQYDTDHQEHDGRRRHQPPCERGRCSHHGEYEQGCQEGFCHVGWLPPVPQMAWNGGGVNNA